VAAVVEAELEEEAVVVEVVVAALRIRCPRSHL
jgi:hypothetical protein